MGRYSRSWGTTEEGAQCQLPRASSAQIPKGEMAEVFLLTLSRAPCAHLMFIWGLGFCLQGMSYPEPPPVLSYCRCEPLPHRQAPAPAPAQPCQLLLTTRQKLSGLTFGNNCKLPLWQQWRKVLWMSMFPLPPEGTVLHAGRSQEKYRTASPDTNKNRTKTKQRRIEMWPKSKQFKVCIKQNIKCII